MLELRLEFICRLDHTTAIPGAKDSNETAQHFRTR